jgi:methylmalonyl-CoA mutase N-terminal domain/subunit
MAARSYSASSSVRRALAIQMIIDQEWGLAKNENPLQGAAIVDELTDLVEEAVLGAMETGYQRGRIQDESMLCEHRKHDGTLPIIGVNTFLREDADGDPDAEVGSPGPPRTRSDVGCNHRSIMALGRRSGRPGPRVTRRSPALPVPADPW